MEALQATEIENLWLLPAGRTSIEPALLVGSRRFRALLEELQRHADVVLIDSPPVLGPPEATLLASMADATLLVVDDGITRHTAARKARDRLMGQESVRLLGVVFNRVRSSTYGHLYGYGYYSKNRKPHHRRKKRPYLTLAEAADRLGVSKVREVAKNPSRSSALFANVVLMRLMLSAGTLVVIVGSAWVLKRSPELILGTAIAACTLFIYAVAGPLESLFIARERLDFLSLWPLDVPEFSGVRGVYPRCVSGWSGRLGGE